MKLRLLGVNDFHGHLEPPAARARRSGLAGRPPRRAPRSPAARSASTPATWSAPPRSSRACFHDEPSIEAANLIGFDVGTLGNHEFDEGGDELLRLLDGGRRAGRGRLERDATVGSSTRRRPDLRRPGFPTSSANVADRDGKLLLPPYESSSAPGVRVGVHRRDHDPVDAALPAAALRGRFRFTDISDAVNRWVPELRRRGVEAIVVLAHSGAPAQQRATARCRAAEIVDEARQMSDAVDVVVAGHSHSLLDLRIAERVGRRDKLSSRRSPTGSRSTRST